MWPVTLSGRLPVVALVSRYLTNKLIGRELLSLHIKLSRNLQAKTAHYAVLTPLSKRYPPQTGRLFTCYSPVCH